MALPVVKTPVFNVTLPSDGRIVKARPFLVREQKVVLHAIEMGDPQQLNNALDDMLGACTFGDVDLNALTVYDVEYLVTQIRAHSVGEVVEIVYMCRNMVPDKLLNAEHIKFQPEVEPIHGKGECDTRIPLKVNLGSLKVSSDERPDNRIMFTDTIGVVMRDMPYGAYKNLTDDSPTDTGISAIASCVEYVINGESVMGVADFTPEELVTWLEDLTGDDFDKLDEYLKTMPTLRISMDLTCPSCGAKEPIKLEGLDDFLV